jgi:hypothetical protein
MATEALAQKIQIKKLRRAGKLRGPKYGLKQTQPQPAQSRPTLSASDTKELARLVRKYGRDGIAAATHEVPLRGRGRPSLGFEPYYKKMHLAEWIEEQAEEHRCAGHRAPYKRAVNDLYELLHGGTQDRDPEKFAKTTKKKYQQGRRDLQLLKQADKQREAWIQAQKGRK